MKLVLVFFGDCYSQINSFLCMCACTEQLKGFLPECIHHQILFHLAKKKRSRTLILIYFIIHSKFYQDTFQKLKIFIDT